MWSQTLFANSTVAVFLCNGTCSIESRSTCCGTVYWGSIDRKNGKNYGKKMIWLGEFSILLSLAVMVPFLKLILGLYQAPADTIGDIYKLLVIITSPMVLFWSTSNVLPNVLRATGDVKFTSYVSLGVMWIVRVGIKLSGIYKIRCRYCGGMDLSGYGMADPKHYIFTPVSFRKMVKNTL